MSLVKCADCDGMLSRNADTCPHCGAPAKKANKWKISDIISAGSAAVAAFALVIGLSQYLSTENWKRREFVANQIKLFYDDKINEAVLMMMDYNPARVLLYNDKPPQEGYREISFDTLINAIERENTSGDEFQVRQYFEHFLRSLYRLDNYMKFEAIKPEELCADFAYPVALMSAQRDVSEQKLKNNQEDITRLAKAINIYAQNWNDDSLHHFMNIINETCNSRTH